MGTTYKGLTVEIDGDTSKFRRSIEQVTSSIKTAEQQARKLTKASKWDDAAQTRTAAASMEQLSSKIGSTVSKYELLNKAISKNDGLLGSMGTSTKRVSQDLANTTARYSDLNEKLEGYYALIKKVDKAVNGSDARFDKDMSGWDTYAKQVLDKYKASGDTKIELPDMNTDSFVEQIRGAKSAYVELREQMGKLRAGEAFVDAKTEAKALEESLEQVSSKYASLQARSNQAKIDDGLKDITDEAKLSASSLEELKSEASQLQRQLGSDGKVSTALSWLKNLNNQLEEAKSRYEALSTAQGSLTVSSAYRGKTSAQLSIDYDSAKSELAAVTREVEGLRAAESGLVTEQNALRASMSAMDSSTQAFVDTQRQLENVEGQLKTTTSELAAAEERQASAATRLNNVQVAQQFNKLGQEAQQAKTEVSELSSTISKFGKKSIAGSGLVTLGRTTMETLTPAASSALMYMTSSADTIDSAYRDMRKTVNGTEEQFESLKQSAIQFSKTSVVSADTILEIEAMGGQLGITADNLEQFATTVSNLDIATDMDSDTIAEDLGKLGTILGLDSGNYENFADALVRLGNNFPALEGDVMNITTRYASMGKIVNMSTDQILAWATAATATGMKSEAAGSSMQRFVSNMESAASKKSEKWAKVLGMTGDEFSKAFSDDASGTMYKFVEGLADIQAKGGSVNKTLTGLGVTGVRDKQLLEGFSQQMREGSKESNTLKDALEAANTAWQGQSWTASDGSVVQAGDALTEAQKKSEGFSGALGTLQNTGTAALNSIADAASPIVVQLADIAAKAETVFEGLPDGAKLAILGGTITTALAGPIINLAGGFTQAWQALTSVESKMARVKKQAVKLNKLQGQGFLNGVDAVAYAANLEGAVQGTENLGKQTRATTAKVKALSVAVKLSKVAVAGLGVALAAVAAEKVADYVKYMEDTKQATTGLTNSISDAAAKAQGLSALSSTASSSAKSLDSASSSASNLSSTASSSAKSLSELAESQAQLAQSQTETVTELNTTSKTAENAYQTIKDSWGKTDADSLAKMKTAVQQLNDALGSDYSVNEETGKIDKLGKSWKKASKSLREYIDDKKRSLALDAYGDMYKNATQAETEAQSTYDKINAAVSSGKENNYGSQYGEQALEDAKKDLEAAKENREKIESLVTALQKSTTTSNDTALDKLYKAVDSDYLQYFDDPDKMLSKLYKSGMTADTWSSLEGQEGFQENLKNWFNEGGIDEAIAGLNQKYGTELKSVGSDWASNIEVGMLERMHEVGSNNVTSTTFKDMKNDLKGLGIDSSDTTAIDAYVSQIENGKSRVEAAWATVGDSLSQSGLTQDWFNKIWEENGGDASKVIAQAQEAKDAIDGLKQDISEADGTQSVLEVLVNGVPNVLSALGATQTNADELDGTQSVLEVATNGLSNVLSAFGVTQAYADELDGKDVTIDVGTSGAETATQNLESVATAAGQVPKKTQTSVIVQQKQETVTPNVLKGKTSTVKVGVTADTSKAQAGVSALEKKASGLKDKTFKVTAKTDDASSRLKGVKNELDSIKSKSVTVSVHKKTSSSTDSNGAQAHGGIFVPRTVPRFASGGIVTHPTYTAHGLVGEAGTEAIIPLSNGRYVRPFANAVANQMQRHSKQSVTNNYYQVGNVTASDGSQVALAVKQLQRAIRMEQRS